MPGMLILGGASESNRLLCSSWLTMTTKKTLRWECLAPGNGYCTDCTCDHDDLAAIPAKREGRSPPVFSSVGLNPVVALVVRLIWTPGENPQGTQAQSNASGPWLFYGLGLYFLMFGVALEERNRFAIAQKGGVWDPLRA